MTVFLLRKMDPDYVEDARVVDTEPSTEQSLMRRMKERLRMFLISLSVAGIDVCYAAEVAFVSPLYLQLGVPVNIMTMCWVISPSLGFFLGPILGGASDSCKSRLGKRRPFIILYAVGISLGLLLVSYGADIGVLLGDSGYNMASGSWNTSIHNITFPTTVDGSDTSPYVPEGTHHTIGTCFLQFILLV